jgi:NTP pyrophosphatase (non-canonical NTP hydrolase)
MSLFKEFEPIRTWAMDRNIHKSPVEKQFLKLLEEVGELSQALQKNNRGELIDAIGDCVIVLTNLAMIKGLSIENCINTAYEEIRNRKGKMIDGVFVKEA